MGARGFREGVGPSGESRLSRQNGVMILRVVVGTIGATGEYCAANEGTFAIVDSNPKNGCPAPARVRGRLLCTPKLTRFDAAVVALAKSVARSREPGLTGAAAISSLAIFKGFGHLGLSMFGGTPGAEVCRTMKTRREENRAGSRGSPEIGRYQERWP
jgi:hypothetical protein